MNMQGQQQTAGNGYGAGNIIVPSAFAVQYGIPIPSRQAQARRTRGCKYPFAYMKVGDSFFVAGKHAGYFYPWRRAFKKLGQTFAERVVVENDVKGVRVWRTK